MNSTASRREDQHQHEGHEEVQVREVPRVARVRLHVADAEQVDQTADAGDDEQQHRGEAIEPEGEVEMQVAGQHPVPQRDLAEGLGPGGLQAQECHDRHAEGGKHDAGPDDGHDALGLGPVEREETVDREADERERHREPERAQGSTGARSLRGELREAHLSRGGG
jgi:hypothetical protein